MQGGTDRASEDQAPTIQIQLRLDGAMPAGVVTGPGGGTQAFTGWVGLMAVVDALSTGTHDEEDVL